MILYYTIKTVKYLYKIKIILCCYQYEEITFMRLIQMIIVFT